MRCGLTDRFIEGVWLLESERTERAPDRAHENVNARTKKGFSSQAYATDWRQLMTAH
jgi:hypothetical protein